MTYYYFDRCNGVTLSDIERIMEEYDLVRTDEGDELISRGTQWKGCKSNGDFLMVTYSPDYLHELAIHSVHDSEEDPALPLVRRLVNICKPGKVVDGGSEPYDLRMFEE